MAAVAAATAASVALASAAPAVADNRRLNDGVVANIYTIQHQAGCTNDVAIDGRLRQVAQTITQDLITPHGPEGAVDSDGPSTQERASEAGFEGPVHVLVAINPALAINGIDILNQWYGNPQYMQWIADCANTAVGVWSENRIDRSAVVAVLGQPSR